MKYKANRFPNNAVTRSNQIVFKSLPIGSLPIFQVYNCAISKRENCELTGHSKTEEITIEQIFNIREYLSKINTVVNIKHYLV